MLKTSVAKVLLFDEEMNNILLVKEDALAALHCTLKEGTLFHEVQKCMASMIHIPINHQPYWWLIRTESFPSADTSVHVLFGKVSLDELIKIEALSAGKYVIISCSAAMLSTKTIAHRLRYLIPMAIVLAQVDSRYWPQP